MCGIVGAASSSLSNGEISLFEDLMVVSNLRGRQGAGIITVTNRKDVHSSKVLGSGINAIESSAYIKRKNDPSVNVLVGHTRWPTKGGTDIHAVHPHAFKNVIGVHNGTLQKVNQEYVKMGDSDSNLLYKHINEVGIKEAINSAKGAYALVFVDYKAKTLNFIRNYERPLWFAKVNWAHFGKTLYWASEKGMLEFVLNRAGVKGYELVELPANELWSLPCPMAGNCEFEKESGIYQDTKGFQRIQAPYSQNNWATGTFLDKAKQSSGTVTLPKPENTFGKETYVWREGRMVAKADPARQVFLSRGSQQADKSEGTNTNAEAVATSTSEGASDEQRSSVLAEVESGGAGRDFVAQVQNFLRPEERELYDDISDLYAEAAMKSGVMPETDDTPWEDMLDEVLDEDTSVSAQDDYETMVETLKSHWITKADKYALLQSGCAWTGDAADMDDEVYWISRREFVTAQALQDPECLADLALHYPRCKVVEDWKAGKLKGVEPPQESHFDTNGNYHPILH